MKIETIKKNILMKLVILVVVLCLVGITFVSSLSHTVDYSNSDYFTDDKDTRIHNSNGNYYEATGAKLQDAIDDLGSNTGTVDTPNATIDFLTTIWVNNSNISIISHGTTFRASVSLPTTGILIIRGDDCLVDGVHFDGNHDWPNNLAQSHGIYLGDQNTPHYRNRVTNCYFENISGNGVEVYRQFGSDIDHNTFRNMGNFTSNTQSGCAVKIQPVNGGSFNMTIAFNDIGRTKEHGIKIYGDGHDSTVRHNNKIIYNDFSDIGNYDLTHGHIGVIQLYSYGDFAIGNTMTLDGWAQSAIMVDGANNTIDDNIIHMLNGDEHTRYGIGALTGSRFNEVIGNTIYGDAVASDVGILIIGDNHFIYNNFVYSVNAEGIKLQTATNCTVDRNFVTGCTDNIWVGTSSFYNTIRNNIVRNATDDGIDETSSGNYNFITGNDVRFNTITGDKAIEHDGVNSIVNNNMGHTTENVGLATVTSGSVSLVVNHNCSITPFTIQLTPRGNLSGAGCDNGWWADTITATQFTIHVSCASGTLTSDIAFSWRADYN